MITTTARRDSQVSAPRDRQHHHWLHGINCRNATDLVERVVENVEKAVVHEVQVIEETLHNLVVTVHEDLHTKINRILLDIDKKNAILEEHFDQVATALVNDIEQKADKLKLTVKRDIDSIKASLKILCERLKVDLIYLLKNISIVDKFIQRIIEILLAIIIQVHAANVPPISEVQGILAAAIIGLQALDIALDADSSLNKHIINSLLDVNKTQPKFGMLGNSILGLKKDIIPSFTHLLRIGEVYGYVPIMLVDPAEFEDTLQSLCDRALAMDIAASQRIANAEAAAKAAANSMANTLFAPLYYMMSLVPESMRSWLTHVSTMQTAAPPQPPKDDATKHLSKPTH